MAPTTRQGVVVLSAGMESAGSGWFFNLTHDLLVAAGNESVRDLRDRHGLGDMLNAHNCNVRDLTPERWRRLAPLAEQGQSFVVKSHRPPTPTVQTEIAAGRLKAFYIYRDPRDVVASAWDRGRTRRARGKDDSFARLRTVPHAVLWMRFRQLPIYEAWRTTEGAMMVRYEDLRNDAVATMIRVRDHLAIDVDDAVVAQLVAASSTESGRKQEGSHYRAGNEKRRALLGGWQLAMCNRVFSRYLRTMGYSTNRD